MTSHLSAPEASKRLGVSRETLYAYVSRGLVRSRAIPGSRRREYHAEDIERIRQRKRGRRDPGTIATEALGFHGMPVLASALTLIDDGRLYYRGREAVELARHSELEDIAELLWQAPLPQVAPFPATPARRRQWRSLPFVERCQSYLAEAGAADPSACNLEPIGVRRVGIAALRGLAAMAVNTKPTNEPVSATLARAWGLGSRHASSIRSALVLCADHELNASTFTARCIASTGASPYVALSGALGALQGHRHGGHTYRVAELLDSRGAPREVLLTRQRRGETIPGFGHALYPEGDPRAEMLLGFCKNARSQRPHRIAHAALQLLDARPNLDFGLVTLARSLDLPADAPFVLFALGRVVGWIGHCLEQYASAQLIRPRARYVGPMPRELTATDGKTRAGSPPDPAP